MAFTAIDTPVCGSWRSRSCSFSHKKSEKAYFLFWYLYSSLLVSLETKPVSKSGKSPSVETQERGNSPKWSENMKFTLYVIIRKVSWSNGWIAVVSQSSQRLKSRQWAHWNRMPTMSFWHWEQESSCTFWFLLALVMSCAVTRALNSPASMTGR